MYRDAMLYCKKCKEEVEKNKTELGQKIVDRERWPNDGVNTASGEKMLVPVRQHKICGGEVFDQESIEGAKKVLHPESK